MSSHIHMLGFLPFLQFLFAEGQPDQGLPEMVPIQMPCPNVWDTTPLRGDQVRELGLWREWLFYWKPREKGWTPINTHVLPETHTAMQTYTSKPFRVSRTEWMGANGASLDRTGKLKEVLPEREVRHVSILLTCRHWKCCLQCVSEMFHFNLTITQKNMQHKILKVTVL